MLQKLSVVLLAVISVFVVSQTATAQTAELTPEKQVVIVQTCVAAQTTLQKIQHNDAATRVNRGQSYETIVNRLMTPLNIRATSNEYNNSAPLLIGTTSKYQQALDSFKKDYENYDDAVSLALKTKCKDKPAVFYGYIEEARTQRQNVANDVATLTTLISDYRNNVQKLKTEVGQ
ncbi:MAG: hypothetical protein Q7T74_02125 [Candidatus Saccharibacteria bacterium]|nr:hypothetical protein [Candidatus Saccharibacteria bacterium]